MSPATARPSPRLWTESRQTTAKEHLFYLLKRSLLSPRNDLCVSLHALAARLGGDPQHVLCLRPEVAANRHIERHPLRTIVGNLHHRTGAVLRPPHLSGNRSATRSARPVRSTGGAGWGLTVGSAWKLATLIVLTGVGTGKVATMQPGAAHVTPVSKSSSRSDSFVLALIGLAGGPSAPSRRNGPLGIESSHSDCGSAFSAGAAGAGSG
eukprot:COSAG04_NODE_3815_length_2502_cov_1.797337_3_plen_209_part_00